MNIEILQCIIKNISNEIIDLKKNMGEISRKQFNPLKKKEQ